MAKVDLHVHSKFSNHPTEWFLKRLGANECYTEPDFIYQTARANGMDFVTITDHNKIEGALRLKAKHADSVITGVEFTAYFPEDQCKIHVLVYGLDEQQYQDIQRIRTDIYQLRDYLKDQDLAHAVAHATYPVNGKLKLAHLEKLILLFDHFEAINGGRNRINNETWMNILSQLTPNHISDLYNKHRIDPISDHPWEKGFTAGSDDHAGLFIGQTYAVVEAQTAEEVIARIKAKQAYASGRHNDYKALAFTVYKVAYDFSKHKKGMLLNSFIKSISEYAFEKRELGMADRLKLKKMKHADKKNGNRIYRLLYDLV